VAAALNILGDKARVTECDDERAQEDIARLAGRWFGAGDALALTRIEARLYRLRIVMAAVRDGVLRSADAKVLDAAAGAELGAALARVETDGSTRGDWFTSSWPTISAKIVERCREQLGPDDIASLAHWFATSGGPGYVVDRGSAKFMDASSSDVTSARAKDKSSREPTGDGRR